MTAPASGGKIGAGAKSLWRDPRIPFAVLLTLYAILGCTLLRFNRSPGQILLTVASACLLDMALHWLLRKRELLFPISAYITGLSLALLLNYSHNYYLLFVPVYFAIGSKYLLTFEGRHVFNPSLFGIALSLIAGGDLITSAPAYQWGGTWAMSAFLVATALSLFVFRIGRGALIVSFLGFYILQTLLRAWWMRWYLPPEALLLGTLTSAPFFLFVFYMITDPKTSPASPRAQVWLAFALVAVDLFFHRMTSLYTFFYAAFVVTAARFLYLHALRLWTARMRVSWSGARRPLRAGALLASLGLAMLGTYRFAIAPRDAGVPLAFRLERVLPERSGLGSTPSAEVLELVDARARHVAKWLLSAGDAAAAADFDGDGRLDLFLTHPVHRAEDRNALYRNLGGLRFERVHLPALAPMSRDPRSHGLASCPIFADYDGDGDQDLFLAVGYGKCVLLANMLAETGRATFVDRTRDAGIDEHSVSIAATFADFDCDGRLDLFIANALAPYLECYEPPRPLNLFRLGEPAFPGDRRMLSFMHSSWDDAKNGGPNVLYRNAGGGRFARLDARALGMPETHWSLAVAATDLNNDGWTDLYVANDFGPDDLYLNEAGRRFRAVRGGIVSSIGRDTYKGMNASAGDLDRNGFQDIYVSNVHVPLQAEGSLLWMNYPRRGDGFVPEFRDEAWQRGVLNEHYFGWGGAIGDVDLDGWLDIFQVNGMSDATLDGRFAECRSYWYVNEKLMRSGPEIHTYADMWGDLRGYCINCSDRNRLYLSRGDRSRLQFVDVAPALGWGEETCARGTLLADFDDDGDLDVLVTRQLAPAALFENVRDFTGGGEGGGGPPAWIGFSLRGDGKTCNRDAAGSRVRVLYEEAGERAEQMREVMITNAFAAQGDRRVLFGLGAHRAPVEVRVAWHGAPEREICYGQLDPGRYHAIEQGSTPPGRTLAEAAIGKAEGRSP
ncbi:MAG: FG-GAP-like repeat-containing protein [Planctomycetes bacterium]|nr:FG-GAP-like repeat-containing protein [Planctomycetota bacterium]